MAVGDEAGETDAAKPTRRRALLLINAKARAGDSSVDGALDFLRDAGFDIEPLEADTPDDMRRALTSGPPVDSLIVGGGDGTLNRAVAALRGTTVTLGILPLGTANDLARTLGIEPNALAAARVIAAGDVRTIDLGEVNGHLYCNVASLGFSAELARDLTGEAKRRWGVFGYGIVSARLLFRMRPFTAFIEHDGTIEKVKTVQISVGSGRHYGGGMTVDVDAEPDDGLLHFYSLEIDHWWRLLTLLPSLRRGTHGRWRDVRTFATREVTVRTRRSRSVNTDGELTTATPAAFRLVPGAIRVYAPLPPPPSTREPEPTSDRIAS